MNQQKSLKKQSTSLKTTVWVGKGGVDQKVLTQILDRTKTKGLVKIKVQQQLYQKEGIDVIINQVLQKTDVKLIDTRGRTFTVFKEPEKDKK